MQPRILTLPDSIRDRLAAPSAARPPRGVHANEQRVRDALFPLHPSPEEQAFLSDFQEAYMGMHTGTSAPAVALRNLPADAKPMLDGLVRFIGNGKRPMSSLIPIGRNHPQLLHHDYHYNPRATRKSLGMLYYIDAGTRPQPTVFVSADDVIEAWATRRQQQHGGSHQAQREAVIGMLSQPDNPVGAQPALARNPNYTPACGAPEYILTGTFTQPHAYGGENKPTEKLTEFDDILYELVHAESKRSTVGTESNTLVLFNQGMCLHGAGYPDQPALQSGRVVQIYDANAHVGRIGDIAAHITAAPTSRVHAVRLLGTTLAQWHQR